MGGANFICRSDGERRRLNDARQRMRRVAPVIAALYMTAGAIGIPYYGLEPLVPVIAAAVVFALLWLRLPRAEHPELVIVLAWAISELAIAASIGLGPPPHAYTLLVLVIPTALVAVIFPWRVVPFFILATLLLLAAVTLLFAMPEVRAAPPVLFGPLGVTLILTGTLSVLRDLDLATRRSAVLDELTGVLNRAALEPRVAELEHQSAAMGAGAAVIAADVDHFKRINDTHGHAAGDAVLRAIGARLTRCVDADESIYRYGGEEFVVLLAGAGAAAAEQIAERMRRAVRATPIDGVTVTMSFGVAASVEGDPFDFASAFTRADAALYRAKLGGRDQVCAAATLSREPAAHPAKPSEAPVRADPPTREADPASSAAGGSWLVANALEREHMLDLNRRLRGVFIICAGLAAAIVIGSAPWFGWATLWPPVIGALVYRLVTERIDSFRRPEYALGAAWMFFQLSIAVGFMQSSDTLFAIPLLVLLVPGTSAVFPRRGVVVGAAWTAALMIVVAFSVQPHEVSVDPAGLAFPLALLGSLALIGSAVGRSAVMFRGASVVDRLTGMLNRTALHARVTELGARTALTGEPVAVVIGDIDHFKLVNDRHGHATGDRVLTAIAGRLRGDLRTFESAYRIGGEEFAVLLSGADAADAAEVAERLRRGIAAGPIEGQSVTMSFGVAASPAGERFDEAEVFARADAALYRAKQEGRDRVCLDAVERDHAIA
jgi:diguanylate cyclase (GGDEF)-like protein